MFTVKLQWLTSLEKAMLAIQGKKFSGPNVDSGYPYTNRICIANTCWYDTITYITSFDQSESSNKKINNYSPESRRARLIQLFSVPLCFRNRSEKVPKWLNPPRISFYSEINWYFYRKHWLERRTSYFHLN